MTKHAEEGYQVRMAVVGLSALVVFYAWGCGRDRQAPPPEVQWTASPRQASLHRLMW